MPDRDRGRPLAGRVAVVTGAAGTIGVSAAQRLAADGATVVLADRDAERLVEVTRALQHTGLDVRSAVSDQSNPESVERLFAEAGPCVDICFANAGYGRPAPVLEQDLTRWRRHLDVNLTGTFLVCRAAARAMVAAGRGGSIIINASTAALHPTSLFAAYAASKAGAEMLARSMAEELGGDDIRVNSVCPGVIESGMTGGLLDQDDGRMRARIEAETPLGRVGRADDVAGVVAFLAGDDAAYVTGATILVDGGQTLRGWPRWFVSDRVDGQARWRLMSAGS